MRNFTFKAFSAAVILTACLFPALAVNSALGSKKADSVLLVRDNFGVPHLAANSARELFYGVGYAHAEDRLWQMELLRLFGTGTAAPILGQEFAEQDFIARAFLPRNKLKEQAQSSPEPTKSLVQAYVVGINAYIQEASAEGTLPVEFLVPDSEPPVYWKPANWTPADVYAVAGFVGLSFGVFGFEDDINHSGMLEYLTEYYQKMGVDSFEAFGTASEIFSDLYWRTEKDPLVYPTIPAGESTPDTLAGTPGSPGTVSALGELATKLHASRDKVKKALGLTPGQPASYGVAIGSKLSAKGAPLLLGAPQVGYSAPGLFLEFGMTGAGFNIKGAGVPGMPFPVVGAGRRHAWTLTSGVSKASYTFIDASDGADYLGCPTISEPYKSDIICNINGRPILAILPQEIGEGKYLYTALSVQSPLPEYLGETVDSLRQLAQARNLGSFEDALRGLAFNFNILYADRRNIAYWHVGKIPQPPFGYVPPLPLSGADIPELPYLSFEQLPKAINPEQGYLVNWNNVPTSDWSYSPGGFQGPVSRAAELADLTQAALNEGPATLRTLKAIDREAATISSVPKGKRFNVPAAFADIVLDAVKPGGDARLRKAVKKIRVWDRRSVDENNDGDYDDPAVTLFQEWWTQLYNIVLKDDLGPGFGDYLNDFEDQVIVSNLLYRLFEKKPALPLNHDYLEGETTKTVATKALEAALDILGDDWETKLTPVAQQDWAPQGVGTVPDTPFANRGSYVQLSAMRRLSPARILNILPPGQSGDYRSPHFADQLPLYAGFKYKQMNRSLRDAIRNRESVRRLVIDQ